MGIFTVNIITGSSSPKLIDIYILEAKCLTAFWKRTERPPIIQLLNNAFLFINGKIRVPTGGKPSDVAAKDDGSPPANINLVKWGFNQFSAHNIHNVYT